MPDNTDYSAAIDDNASDIRASSNLNGAKAVSPEDAVYGYRYGPAAGVPPALAMHNPQQPREMAQSQNDQAILQTSPPVRQWVSSDPNRAAASQDDLSGLAGVAQQVGRDFMAPVKSAWAQMQQQSGQNWDHLFHPTIADMANPASMQVRGAATLWDALNVVYSPLVGAINTVGAPVGKGLAQAGVPIPRVTLDLKSPDSNLFDPSQWTANIRQATKQEAGQEFGSIITGLGSLYALGRGGRAARGGADARQPGLDDPQQPTDGGPPTSGAPFHTGQAWNTNAEGFLADEDGNSVAFTNPREAASWRMQNGGDQVFEPDLHQGGVGLRDVQVRPDDPYWTSRRTNNPTPGVDPQMDEVLKTQADQNADIVKSQEDALSESKLFQRSPEMAQEFLQDQGVGEKTAHVDPFVLRELYSNGETPFKSRIEDIEDAMFRGSEVSIPHDEYLTEMAGKPYADQVREATRFTDGGISQATAADLKENGEPAFTTEVDDKGFTVSPEQKVPKTEGTGVPPQQGKLSGRREGNNLIVESSFLPESMRGQGIGKAMYTQAAEAALDQGGEFHSDSEVSPQAQNIWDSLAKRYKVEKNPDAVASAPGENPDLFTTDKSPVYKLTGRLEPEKNVKLPEDMPPEVQKPARALAAKADDIIEQVFQEQFLKQLFANPKAAGMTKAQFDRYNERIENAKADARERVLEKLYAQVRRERKPDWKAAVELRTEEATQEIEGRKAIQAYKVLRDPDFKLDRDLVNERYLELAGELPQHLVKRGGADPDEVAELTGHGSGAELVSDIVFLKRAMDAVGARNIDAFVKHLAKDLALGKAREDVGYDMSDESIMQEVSARAAEEPIESFLVDELQSLAKQVGLTLDKAAIKDEALRLFSKMEVGDALKIKEFERAMWHTGRAAEMGLLKEKPIEAFLAKQKQLLNHYMLAESHALNKAFGNFMKMGNRLSSRATFSAIDQDYLNHIHQALMQLGFHVRRNAQELQDALGGQTLAEFVEDKTSQGKELAVGYIPTVESAKKLRVSEFAMVHDSIKSLEHVGRQERAIDLLGKSMDFNEALDQAMAQLNAIGEHFTFDQLRKILDNPLDAGHYARWADGSMVKPEQLMDWMDRDQRGIFNQVVTEPIQQAKHDQDDLEASVSKKIVEFRKTQPKRWDKTLKEQVDVPELSFTRDGVPEKVVASKKDIITLALNWGNESNVDKLIRGYNWNYEDVENALNKYMKPEDWAFVEHVWSLFSDLWPQAEAMYRRMSGVAPPRVVPRDFEHAFGTSHGGYYPVVFDPWLAPRAGGKKGDMFDPRYARATPPNPYANARTGAAYPIELNLDMVSYRLGQVIHDITHREALINAEKFLLHPRVKQKMTFVFGPEYADQMRPFLEYVANAKVFDDKALGFWANLIKNFRMNTTMVGLGFRATTIFKHGSSAAFNSIAEVGAKNLAAATAAWAKDPKGVYDLVTSKSGEVRNRLSNMDREIRESYRSLYQKQGFISMAQHYAFHGVGFSDLASAVPTWLAAYHQAMRETGGDETASVQTADKRVRQAHGASGSADLAAIQRSEDTAGGQLWKSMSMFISFMNHMYNRDRANIRLMTDASNRKGEGDYAGARRDFGKGLARSFWYWVPVIAIEQAINHELGDKSDFLSSMIKGVIWRGTSGVPILRDVVDALQHGADFEGSPLVKSVQTVINSSEDAITAALGEKAAKEITGKGHNVSKRWLQHGMETAGYLSGWPLGQAGATTQYLSDYATGREHPKDFGTFLHGLTYGHTKK